MAKRQKSWARKARVALMELLGNKCVKCDSVELLEFDCISPCGDEHHKMSTCARMSFYRKQHKLGNIQILCTKCHNKKTCDELGFINKQPF
jgi:hypothetical protein